MRWGSPKKTSTCSLIAHQRRRISKIRSVKHLILSLRTWRTPKINFQKIKFSFFFGPFWVLFWPVLSSFLTLLSFLWAERLRPRANQHTGHIQGIMGARATTKNPQKKLSKFGPNLSPHHPQQADTVPALTVCVWKLDTPPRTVQLSKIAAHCPHTGRAYIHIWINQN